MDLNNDEAKKAVKSIRTACKNIEQSVVDNILLQNTANVPIVEQLKQLVEQTQLQNNFLNEENKRQKQQLLQSQKNEELARKEAKSSKIFSYISFGVATVLSIIALVVAIIK